MATTSRSSLKLKRAKLQTLFGIVIDRDGLPSDWYLYREDKDNKISHASSILKELQTRKTCTMHISWDYVGILMRL